MALSSISMTIANDPYSGCVNVTSTQRTSSLGSIAYLMLYRRVYGSGDSYTQILEKQISSASDLSFAVKDITAGSNTAYEYYVELKNGNSTGSNVLEFKTFGPVEVWFNGIFVGDYDKQYMAHLNCSTSITRNTQCEYVNTLAARTPYRVSNSVLNYTSGQSSGLFCRLDQYGQPITETNNVYRNEVVDFLTDGENKIVKTSDGGAWYVSIDPGVSTAHDDHYIGANTISFSWTEVDDVPYLRTVS